jgi:glutathione synthase/RimK-type ligase-like ATP-grasp enzyme
MEKYNRKAISTELAKYCILSDEYDLIEATEWHNGEGFDVCISTKGSDENFKLTYGQFKALKKCIKELERNE